MQKTENARNRLKRSAASSSFRGQRGASRGPASPPKSYASRRGRKSRRGLYSCLGCLGGCLGLVAVGVLMVAALPFILQALGIVGPPAEVVYSGAPDPYASQQLQSVFEERGIAGVRVYVIPIKDQESQAAFIILDSSRGYTGLSPLEDSDAVFVEVLRDLSDRNRQEDLRVSRVAIEFRDENGQSALSFTTTQENVDSFASGRISRDEFFAGVDFPLVDTLRYFGIDQLLREVSQ